MPNPYFSIVIPSFNQGQFLEDCILSILSQDFDDVEIILMDGGSSDNSLDIIQKYQDNFSYWQSCADNGQADAISQGFSRSKGSFLLWLNSDDILLPKSLTTYHDILCSRKEIHFLYSNMILVSPNSERIGSRLLTPLPPVLSRLAVNTGLFGFYQPASVWSSSVYQFVGGINPQLQFAMDNDLFARIIAAISLDSVYFLDALTAGFRVHPGQKTLNLPSVGHDERNLTTHKIPLPYRYLLHLWVRFWRFLYYLYRGQAFHILGSRIYSKYRQIP